MPEDIDRRGRICAQLDPAGGSGGIATVTGIDFIRVVDPGDQRELEIFLIVDPHLVTYPAAPSMMASTPFPEPFAGAVTATALGGEAEGQVLVAEPSESEWREVVVGGVTRVVLRVRFAVAGTFSDYRLHVDHPAIDPWFNDIVFSFKQGCPSDFDCREEDCCPAQDSRDVEIDYLARDFDSLGMALRDFAARYYPEWQEESLADTGHMLFDLLAALGDEFSYMQDRFSTEATLETARQRRSLWRLAKMLDYHPEPGRNASCLLALTMRSMGAAAAPLVLQFAERLRFWSTPEGRDPIPFELGNAIADTGTLSVHSSWNAMEVYLPDAGAPCLQAGATHLYLAPDQSNLPLPRGGPAQWEVGRRMILRSRPTDRSLPDRAWPITIESVEHGIVDLLREHDAGGATQLTRLRWREDEALPFAMRIAETRLYGNVAPATAGSTKVEHFTVGELPPDGPASWRDDPRAVEREGMQEGEHCMRATAIIAGLLASEESGLNHIDDDLSADRSIPVPDLVLTQTGSDFADAPSLPAWTFRDRLIDGDADDRIFTLDPGMWRRLLHYDRNGRQVVHRDYASNDGWSLRFGSGDYGRGPQAGDRFEVRYRTLLGVRSNVATNAVRTIAPLDDSDPAPAILGSVERVDNFLPASGGLDPESAQSIRQMAPDHWRALPLNAIRDEHFRAIVEREDWVQQAGARTRWTGSWPTHFVSADPIAERAGDPEVPHLLDDLVDSVRMAGRDHCVREALTVALDIEIVICVEDGHYEGQVRENVLAALIGEPCSDARPFFHDDNFTFGTPLRRGKLVAAVQAVPGVMGVVGICIRRRGRVTWEPFDAPRLEVAVNEIIRVDHDPSTPGSGSIAVRVSESAEPAGCACCTA